MGSIIIRIFTISLVSVTTGSSQNTVRIVGGEDTMEGRVEILHNDEWGTVCDDRWNDTDATVVCRQMGLGNAGEAVGGAIFGEGSGTIWLDEVSCGGSEDSVQECGSNGWGNNDCQHWEDAGVRCREFVPVVRLVEGSSTKEGRVEVLYDGEWGTVCDDYWDDIDATVVCRVLGLGTSGEAVRKAGFGEGEGRIWLDNVGCTGCDQNLHTCRSKNWGSVGGCDHDEDAGVRCGDFVRLAGGDNVTEGRVEVLHDGGWGTIGDGNWDDADATVVCRQLGLAIPGRAVSDARFGEANGEVWLDDIACLGYENSLHLCRKSNWGPHDREHRKDAGVRCVGIDQMNPSDDVDDRSQKDANRSVKQCNPALYIIISLLTLIVFVLVVYIVIQRNETKKQGQNVMDGTSSASDLIRSLVPNMFLKKRVDAGRKNDPISQMSGEKIHSVQHSPEKETEVYSPCYENSGTGDLAAASREHGEVYNCVYGQSSHKPKGKNCTLSGTAGPQNGAREDGPGHEYAIPDEKSVTTSGEPADYQYVQY